MSRLKNDFDDTFEPKKTYALSPKVKFGEGGSPLNSRYSLMGQLMAYINCMELVLCSKGKEIKIFQHSQDFIQNDKYWGGDAVLLTVAADSDGCDISSSPRLRNFIVYDQTEDKYFTEGKEIPVPYRTDRICVVSAQEEPPPP